MDGWIEGENSGDGVERIEWGRESAGRLSLCWKREEKEEEEKGKGSEEGAASAE